MIDVLTSFRFVAALMVFLWHTHTLSGVLDKYQLGYVGVGFFYVLSGFILTYVYSKKVKKLFSKSTIDFFVARFAKIYPVHLLTMILAIPLAVYLGYYHDSYQWISVTLTNVLLIQSWFSDPLIHFGLNGVSWSISVEYFFYLCFPLIVVSMAKYAKTIKLRVFVPTLVLFWLMIMYFYSKQTVSIDDWAHYISPLVRLPEFIMGILLYKLYQNRRINKEFSERYGTHLEIITIIILIIGAQISTILPQSLRFGVFMLPFWMLLIYIYSHQSGVLSRIFSHRTFVYLGEISFSFYMLHLLVIRVLKLNFEMNYKLAIIALLLSVIFSALSYSLYEEPVRKFLRSLMYRIYRT